MTANTVVLAEPFSEDKKCLGCKKIIVNDGSTVVSFGQSFFHVDCFRCAKCMNKVTADTNLLLLSDGSPVCSNCSYNCKICGLPILDEAIMTGEESYHAHCFNCKVCKKRIEELVFAKTATGIYCMDCHNARVARSRRHHDRREREKREREKERAAANAAVVPDAGGSRSSDDQARSISNGTRPLDVHYRPEARTNGQPSTPRSSDFVAGVGPSAMSRGPSSSSTVDERHYAPRSPVRQNTVSVPYSDGQSATNPASGSAHDHLRSSSTPITNMDTLAIPSDGMNKTMQKRKSFDDRPLDVLLKDATGPGEASHSRQDSLLVPDSGTSRKERRRSINPALAMTFSNMSKAPQNSSTAASPTSSSNPNSTNPQTPPGQGREYARVSSPLREQFPIEVTSSPPSMAENIPANSFISPPYLQLDTSSNTDKHVVGRSRSASSSAYPEQSHPQAPGLYERQRSRSPIRPNFTLDHLPARTSSRADHRNETAPPGYIPDGGRNTPQLSTEGRASPSISALNGAHIHKQRSFDDRSRYSTSSLSQSIDLPSLKGNSRPTSPSHKVDVPHGIESGTDTEAEGEEEEFITQNDWESLPPLPPPKEGKGSKVGTRPPHLTLNTSHAEDRDTLEAGQIDSEDLSEDFSHEEPVESTSHSTFIAPALPPIRFSIGGGDFSELFKGVTGPEPVKSLDQIVAVIEKNQLRVDVTPPPPSTPPSATQTATPTNGTSRRDHSVDATPIRRQPNGISDQEADAQDLTIRREPINRSRTPSPSPRPLTEFRKQSIDAPRADSLLGKSSLSRPSAELAVSERSRSYSDTRDFRPTFDRIRRKRGDSNASIVPTGITVTSPDNATSKVLRPDTSELVRTRLHEALADVKERKSSHVKLDSEFVEAILMLLDQHKEDHSEMKRKLDGMKRASQQYVDGLSVAQTEYDRELKARRDAEAEVTRLRVLLSGQAVRLTAVLGETKRQEAQKQLSRELSDSLASLEKELAKLQVERDMTLAEVEELSASKSSPLLPEDSDAAGTLSRALSVRFDSIKTQYQHELLPLTTQKESLLREIAELRASRDGFLEEATILNARNEELAQLNAQYVRRVDSGVDFDRRGDSIDKVRPNLSSSVTSSTVAFSEESGERFIKISKPDASEVPAPQASRPKFIKWPGSKSQAPKDVPASNDVNKAKARVEHNFQSISMLRVSRCDHCGDKMWGSQLRCSACNIAVHTRCVHQVHAVCSQQSAHAREESAPAPVGPSLFGRDLVEQVKADSKDEARAVPVIVEKCINAVDALALDYEGIYRKTGGSGQSKMITQLFERGDYASFDLLDTDRFNDICSVTSVLKTYFRSLPDPLLTYTLHERFIAASMTKEPEMKSKLLTELVAELPKEHYHTTSALMLHLHRVCEKSEVNLMHARNLGVVFGPTLMRSRDPNAEFADMAGKALTVEWLVENAQTLFGQADSLEKESSQAQIQPQAQTQA